MNYLLSLFFKNHNLLQIFIIPPLGNTVTKSIFDFLSGIKTAAILTSTYVMDEEEIIQLMADNTVITYILGVVGKALKVRSHRADGYSCLELVQGLTVLALSDDMKRMLVQNGVLPYLTKVLEVGDAAEKEQATKVLWTLAFHKENRPKLLVGIEVVGGVSRGFYSVFLQEKKQTFNQYLLILILF